MSSTSRWPRRAVLRLAGSGLTARWATAAVRAQGAARAVVDEPARVDLGVVALGSDPEVRFTIRNQGEMPLTVTPGRVAAGLRVEHVDGSIAPSASGQVRLRLDTFRVGQTMDWTIPLTTNDPQRETVVLQVRADVRTFVLITPPTARFTYVQHEREGGTTHLVGAAGDPSFRITRVESPYPFLDATAAPAPPDTPRPDGVDGPMWQVSLVIRKHAAVGPLAGVVVLHTTHPKQSLARLSVSGFVRPLIAVTPPAATIPPPAPTGDAESAPMLVVNFGEAPLELTAAETTIAGVTAAIAPLEAGRRWQVRLRVSADAVRGPMSGELRLRTSRADVPPVVVSLSRP